MITAFEWKTLLGQTHFRTKPMLGGKRLSHEGGGGGIQDLTPVYGRIDADAEDFLMDPEIDLASTFTPFGSSWEVSSPLRGTRVSNMIAASMGDLSSSGSWSDDRHNQGGDNELLVEKSQILEQLQLAKDEVEELEDKLAAAKRKRSRTVSAALEKHKKKQQTEAKEMRTVLGSINQLNLSEASGARAASPKNTLSTPTTTNLSLGIIQRLQSFTNIHFTSIQNYILTARNLGRCRQYNVSGTCFQLDFKLEFTVNEPALSVENLHIEVSSSIRTELGDFIAESERKSLLLPFFEVFAQYAQLDHDRQIMMRKLSQKFPQLVKTNHKGSPSWTSTTRRKLAGPNILAGGPGVQVLVFGGSNKSPELIFQWVIDITNDAKIMPRVRMLPRMPRSWRQLDDKATLDAIPSQFLRLVQLKGVEGAVTILLECVYGRQATRTDPPPDDPDLSDE